MLENRALLGTILECMAVKRDVSSDIPSPEVDGFVAFAMGAGASGSDVGRYTISLLDVSSQRNTRRSLVNIHRKIWQYQSHVLVSR